jgi:hypothetical protein
MAEQHHHRQEIVQVLQEIDLFHTIEIELRTRRHDTKSRPHQVRSRMRHLPPGRAGLADAAAKW